MFKMSFYLIFISFAFITKIFSKDPTTDLPDEEYSLIDISEASIQRFIKNADHFFLLIHSPWCRWSQKLETALINMNKLLKLERQPYYLGKLDATHNNITQVIEGNVAKEALNPILTYPKILYFKEGEFQEVYNGPHKFNFIHSYIMREPINISSLDIFDYKTKHENNAFVYFDNVARENNEKNSNFLEILKKFEEQNKEKKDYVFYYSQNKIIDDKLNESKNATIIHYRKGIPKNYFTLPDFSIDDIKYFIKTSLLKNYYSKINDEYIQQVFIEKRPSFVIFRNTYENKTDEIEAELPGLARLYPEIIFTKTDVMGKYEIKMAKLLRISLNNLPEGRLFDFKPEIRRFQLNENDLKLETIKEFLENWRQDKLTPFIPTLIVNDKQTPQGQIVKQISIADYHSKVMLSKGNVVVYFYTEWCSLCKKFKSVFDQLSTKFPENLYSFYIFNIDENENSYIHIDRVPSVQFYSAGDKMEPKTYFGELKLKPLIDFIKNEDEMNKNKGIKTDL